MNAIRKRWLLFGVRALVSMALLYYLIHIIQWPRVRAVLAASNPYLFFAAVPMPLFSIGCMALRWRLLLLRIGVKIGIFRLFGYYLVGSCFNIFLPGVIGGDVVRLAYCAQQSGKRLRTITGVVVLERACGLVALFAVGGAVSYLMPKDVWIQLGDSLVPLFRLTAILLVIFFIGTWLAGYWIREYLTNNRLWIFRRLEEILSALSRIDPTTLAVVMILSALAQGVDLMAAYVLAQALGIELALGFFFIIIPVTYLVTLLPVSLGGIGVREGIFSYLLTRMGVLASDAVTLAFSIYLLRIFVGTLGGVWYLMLREPSLSTKESVRQR